MMINARWLLAEVNFVLLDKLQLIIWLNYSSIILQQLIQNHNFLESEEEDDNGPIDLMNEIFEIEEMEDLDGSDGGDSDDEDGGMIADTEMVFFL